MKCQAFARNSDPITSHRAADRMNEGNRLSNDERFALLAIRNYPGRTANELEALMNDKKGKIHRRIKGLVNKSKVKRVYKENCREALLYPVEFRETLFERY